MLQSLLVEYKFKGSHLQLPSHPGGGADRPRGAAQVRNARWPLGHLCDGTAEPTNAVANADSVRAGETTSFHAVGSHLLNTFIPEKAGKCL